MKKHLSKIRKELIEKGIYQTYDEEIELSSGKKRKFYFDARLILSHPLLRNQIAEELRKNVPIDTDIIAGIETGSLPIAFLVANILQLPFIYVRKKPKEHGKKQQIKGDYNLSDKVVLIKDVITTGNSVMSAKNVLENNGLSVNKILCIFNDKTLQKYFEIQLHRTKFFALFNETDFIKI
jgi:orotate phosphoribosyltransferase